MKKQTIQLQKELKDTGNYSVVVTIIADGYYEEKKGKKK